MRVVQLSGSCPKEAIFHRLFFQGSNSGRTSTLQGSRDGIQGWNAIPMYTAFQIMICQLWRIQITFHPWFTFPRGKIQSIAWITPEFFGFHSGIIFKCWILTPENFTKSGNPWIMFFHGLEVKDSMFRFILEFKPLNIFFKGQIWYKSWITPEFFFSWLKNEDSRFLFLQISISTWNYNPWIFSRVRSPLNFL